MRWWCVGVLTLGVLGGGCEGAHTPKSSSRSGSGGGVGVVYRRNFYSRYVAERVREEVRKLVRESSRPERGSIAIGRRGGFLPQGSVSLSTLQSEELTGSRIARLLELEEDDALYPGDYPPEFRLYPVGSCMDWHVDDRLYEEPQYELIYTVENTSDSATEWIDGGGCVHSEWTEPNSLIVIQAEGLLHRATHVSRGERVILKAIWTKSLKRDVKFEENLGISAYKRRGKKKKKTTTKK